MSKAFARLVCVEFCLTPHSERRKVCALLTAAGEAEQRDEAARQRMKRPWRGAEGTGPVQQAHHCADEVGVEGDHVRLKFLEESLDLGLAPLLLGLVPAEHRLSRCIRGSPGHTTLVSAAKPTRRCNAAFRVFARPLR